MKNCQPKECLWSLMKDEREMKDSVKYSTGFAESTNQG